METRAENQEVILRAHSHHDGAIVSIPFNKVAVFHIKSEGLDNPITVIYGMDADDHNKGVDLAMVDETPQQILKQSKADVPVLKLNLFHGAEAVIMPLSVFKKLDIARNSAETASLGTIYNEGGEAFFETLVKVSQTPDEVREMVRGIEKDIKQSVARVKKEMFEKSVENIDRTQNPIKRRRLFLNRPKK